MKDCDCDPEIDKLYDRLDAVKTAAKTLYDKLNSVDCLACNNGLPSADCWVCVEMKALKTALDKN